MAAMEPWVSRDYGGIGRGLTMSKERLGLFVYHVLRNGGRITSTHAMAPRMDRTYVQMAVMLPAGTREAVERDSGITLEKPPVMIPA